MSSKQRGGKRNKKQPVLTLNNELDVSNDNQPVLTIEENKEPKKYKSSLLPYKLKFNIYDTKKKPLNNIIKIINDIPYNKPLNNVDKLYKAFVGNFFKNSVKILPNEMNIVDNIYNNAEHDDKGIKLFNDIIINKNPEEYKLLLLYIFTKYSQQSLKKSSLSKDYGIDYTADTVETLNKFNNKIINKLYEHMNIEDHIPDIAEKIKYDDNTQLQEYIDKNNDAYDEWMDNVKNDVDYLSNKIDKIKNKTLDEYNNKQSEIINIIKYLFTNNNNFNATALKDSDNVSNFININKSKKNFSSILKNEKNKIVVNANANDYNDVDTANAYISELNDFFNGDSLESNDAYINNLNKLDRDKDNINKYKDSKLIKLSDAQSSIDVNNRNTSTIYNDLMSQFINYSKAHKMTTPELTLDNDVTPIDVPTRKLEDIITEFDTINQPDNTTIILKDKIDELKKDPTNTEKLKEISDNIKTMDNKDDNRKFLENQILNSLDKYFTSTVEKDIKARQVLPAQYTSLFNKDWNDLLDKDPYLKNLYTLLEEVNKDKATILKEQLAHNFYEKYKYFKLINPTVLNNQNWLNINKFMKEILNDKSQKNMYKIIKSIATLNNIDKDNSIYKHRDENIPKTQLGKLSLKYKNLLSSYQQSPQQNISSGIQPLLYDSNEELAAETSTETVDETHAPKLSISHK